MLYLDHAATTAVRPETREAMAPYLRDEFGNPSGIHGVSRSAKNAMEAARERAAEMLGASHPLEIVFTSGGTEADNLAVVGTALGRGGRGSIVTNAAEHDAVLQAAAFAGRIGCAVTVVGVDENGAADPASYADAIDGSTAVASVMLANNEVGVVNDVAAIAAAVREQNSDTVIHTDAVQAFISEDVTIAATGADLIALSAHKFGGPKGVGLLVVPRGLDIEPVLHGGGQELGMRSGTHNVAGIVGMVAAMEATVADRAAFRSRIAEARNSFERALRFGLPGLEITAEGAHRLVQHSHVRIKGVASETLLIMLDQAGVAAAAGSACHSGALEISHVLDAMGFDDDKAAESVRFSFGWEHDATDGENAAARVIDVAGGLL